MKTQISTYMACLAVGTSFAVLNGGCGSAPATGAVEDTSTSGSVAAMVGGSNSSSGGSGSLGFYEAPRARNHRLIDLLKDGLSMHDALAATVCPTIGGSASGCALSGSTLTMTYGNAPGCSFGSATATWTGSQAIAFSAGSPTCSAFPTSYSGTVTRTFGSGTARTAASGTGVSIDTTGAANAADGHSYSGGTTVTFSSGARTQIAVNGINYVATNAAGKTLFNHTMTTSPFGGSSTPLTITNGVANGAVTTFHNLIKVAATSTLSNVTFTAGCCQPTSGTITTSFTALSGATAAAQAFVAKGNETLTFTGCGTATYSGPEAQSGNVTLAHCL